MPRRLAPILAAAALAVLAPVPAGAKTVFTMTGHGWGHGIGMSQYGALGYALHGYSYSQILGHYFTGTHVAPVSKGVSERVLMESGRSAIDVSAGAPITIVDNANGDRTTIPAGAYRVRFGTTPGRLQVVDRSTKTLAVKGLVGPVGVLPTSAPLALDDATGMGFTGDHWHGALRIVASGHTLDCLNVVSMEQYVRGVVPIEVSASWPKAALRAQAIATRSYAYATRNPGGSFDAYSDTRSQAYGPIEREAAASTAAVQDTRFKVVWSGSTIATTFFSSSSGGRTSSEQASWGTSSGPAYLVPVSDPYDRALGRNPNHTWAPVTSTPAGLARRFGYTRAILSVDHVIDRASQRVLELRLHTRAGDHTLTGPGVQTRLGLRSTYFRLLQTTLAAPRSVKAGTTITVRGRVWPRPSARVSLLRRTGTSRTWTVAVDHVRLGADGRFALRVTPTKDKHYSLRTRNGAVSPVVYVQVS